MSGPILEGLSTSERDKELFDGAPNLGAAFKDVAGQDHGSRQRELAIQNNLLRSYTNTREEWKSEFEGMSYANRLQIIEKMVDEKGQRQYVDGIEDAIESKKNQVELFRGLGLSNEEAAELKEAYEFVRHQRLPVQNYDEVKAFEDSTVVYSKEFLSDVKSGYNKDNHSLKSGDITYDLKIVDEAGENIGLINENGLKGQFTTQFESLEAPNFVYTRQGTYGMEYAQIVEMTENRQSFGLTPVSMTVGEERVVENGQVRYEQNEAFEQEAHRVSKNSHGTPLVDSVSAVEASGPVLQEGQLPSADMSDVKLPTPDSNGP